MISHNKNGKSKGSIPGSQTLMGDNPVRWSQRTVYQSYTNLSVLNNTSPVKMLDIRI